MKRICRILPVLLVPLLLLAACFGVVGQAVRRWFPQTSAAAYLLAVAAVVLGSQLGTLTVTSGEEVVAELPILAGEEIPRITFVQMLVRMLQTAFLAD